MAPPRRPLDRAVARHVVEQRRGRRAGGAARQVARVILHPAAEAFLAHLAQVRADAEAQPLGLRVLQERRWEEM